MRIRFVNLRPVSSVRLRLAAACLTGACLAGLVGACSADLFPAGESAAVASATGPPTIVEPASEVPAMGTLTGHLYAVGGPAPGTPRPWSGTITLTGSGVHRDIEIGAGGRFSVVVPVGTYVLAGHSPLYQSGTGVCRAAGPATVTLGHRTRADVLCQLR